MATPLQPDESDRLKKEFLEAFRQNGGYSYAAAKIVQVRYSTVHYWMTHDDEFNNACKDLKELMIDRAEAELYHRAINGKDRDACLLFYLKTKGKERGYVERFETTGKDGGAIQTEIRDFKANETDADLVGRIKQQAISEYLINKGSDDQ